MGLVDKTSSVICTRCSRLRCLLEHKPSECMYIHVYHAGVSLQGGRVALDHSTCIYYPLMWLKECKKIMFEAFDLSPKPMCMI